MRSDSVEGRSIHLREPTHFDDIFAIGVTDSFHFRFHVFIERGSIPTKSSKIERRAAEAGDEGGHANCVIDENTEKQIAD